MIIYGGLGLLVIIVIILKFTVLRKNAVDTADMTGAQAPAPVAEAPQTSLRNITPQTAVNPVPPKPQAAQPGAPSQTKPPVKREFHGYSQINDVFQSSSEITVETQIEVIQNVFQDFKRSLEQKNKAKAARLKADEAISNLMAVISKLRETNRRAMEKYLESPKNYVDLADKNFADGSYLEAENYAYKAVNLCESMNVNTLEKLIRETITFKYKGFYNVGEQKVAILLMIRSASGIIEGTTKQYINVKEGDSINVNEYNNFKIDTIAPENVQMTNIAENKKLSLDFELSQTGKENK